ncbi:MAG TPA: hemolysin family protein [Phototrophicaceae bacterium]|nr:hemolysin family protein [Phototrophicaceae bacterium]
MFYLLVILFLILANGFLVMAQTALVAARKSQLQDWISRGNRRAKIALRLSGEPNRVLATIQATIRFLVIVSGVLAGRSLVLPFTDRLVEVPLIGTYGREVSPVIVVLVLSYFSLTVGELIPRRLASLYPETIAVLVARPLELLTRIAWPITRLLEFSTELGSRLFGRETVSTPQITEDEIKTLVKQGTEAGVFEETEQDMVEAVLRLGDKRARSLMTPRTQIAWLDRDDSIERIREKIIASGHSCFPVATGSLDKVDGIVQSKDLLAHSLAGQGLDLGSLMQQPLFVPRTITALEILESFKNSGQHIALVVDEYGGIEGLLTHHDILEAIAGDIPFNGRPNDPKAVRRHDGSWLFDGMLSIDEFKEVFHLDDLPGEKRDAYQTLGGFLFTRMGRIPSVSEYFEWNGLRFEVVDMDGKRIDKILVAPLLSETERSATSLAPYRNETAAK